MYILLWALSPECFKRRPEDLVPSKTRMRSLEDSKTQKIDDTVRHVLFRGLMVFQQERAGVGVSLARNGLGCLAIDALHANFPPSCAGAQHLFLRAVGPLHVNDTLGLVFSSRSPSGVMLIE